MGSTNSNAAPAATTTTSTPTTVDLEQNKQASLMYLDIRERMDSSTKRINNMFILAFLLIIVMMLFPGFLEKIGIPLWPLSSSQSSVLS